MFGFGEFARGSDSTKGAIYAGGTTICTCVGNVCAMRRKFSVSAEMPEITKFKSDEICYIVRACTNFVSVACGRAALD